MSHGRRHRHNLYQAGYPESLSRFIPGNQVTLIQNGEAYFPAIEAAFDRARHEIYLETYIYENDATGQRIADALKRAALRGVNVHVLIDGYGSKDLPRSMLDQLRAVGVKTLIYRPKISPWTFRRKRLRRMHRKIAVVDREIAFVGGINIIDDREADGRHAPALRLRSSRGRAAGGRDPPFRPAPVVNGGVESFSQRNGPGRGTACFNLRRWAHERGIPGAGQFPPSPGH